MVSLQRGEESSLPTFLSLSPWFSQTTGGALSPQRSILRSGIANAGSGVRKRNGDWDWYGRWIANSYVAVERMHRAVGCAPGERSLCWSSSRVGIRELSWRMTRSRYWRKRRKGRARLFFFLISESLLSFTGMNMPSTDRPTSKPAASIETPQPGTCCS